MADLRIFDVPIDGREKHDLMHLMGEFVHSEGSRQIVTANPEMLMASRENRRLKQVMQLADLVVADGAGIVFVAKWLYRKTIARITGNDVIQELLRAATPGTVVYLLGGKDREAHLAAQQLESHYTDLRFVADEGGRVNNIGGVWQQEPDLVGRIQRAEPHILLVALGHGKQETWIRDHLGQLPSVHVAVGVGGAFAFLAGTAKRAPNWMQKLWLEWVWRLITEPWRIKRIITAAFVFSTRCNQRKKTGLNPSS